MENLDEEFRDTAGFFGSIVGRPTHTIRYITASVCLGKSASYGGRPQCRKSGQLGPVCLVSLVLCQDYDWALSAG